MKLSCYQILFINKTNTLVSLGRKPDNSFDTDRVFQFLLSHYRKVLTPYGKVRLVEGSLPAVPNRAGRYKVRSVHHSERDLQGLSFDLAGYFIISCACALLLFTLFMFLSKRRLKGELIDERGSYSRLSPSKISP